MFKRKFKVYFAALISNFVTDPSLLVLLLCKYTNVLLGSFLYCNYRFSQQFISELIANERNKLYASP